MWYNPGVSGPENYNAPAHLPLRAQQTVQSEHQHYQHSAASKTFQNQFQG